MLKISNLNKNYGRQNILSDISFELKKGECIGILGANGCGKSTLFKLILGELDADEGKVYISKDKTIGILRQDDAFCCFEDDDSDRTLLEVMYNSFPELLKAEKRLSELEEDARRRIAEREGERLADRVCRSLGILRYSRLLSSGELSARLTDLRLGGALGLIETLPPRKLTELSIAARPATLMMSGEGLENESARDKARAALVRAALSGSGE